MGDDVTKERNGVKSKAHGGDNDAENSADGAELNETADDGASSVANLREWLDSFGKKNREHFEKQKATSATANVKLSPVRRPTVRRSFETGPTPLPGEAASLLARRLVATNRQPSTGKKQSESDTANVQATNEGYASVAELSKWLADDPTSSKKVRHLRRGANILAKAQAYDKGLSNTIAIENKIHRGGVSASKKRWESRAADHKAPNKPTTPQYAQSDIVTSKELSDFGGMAKQKWRNRPMKNESVQHADLKPAVSVDTTKSASVDGPPSWKSECSLRSTSSVSSRRSTISSSSRRSSRSPLGPKLVVKSSSPVGFFKARELLVKRSIANGKNVDLVVQRRKAKFENLSKDSRGGATEENLLKPSWDVQEGNYVKKYISNIPQKKSFDELP